MPENIVSFEDWSKLDLRVGEIVEVEDIEGADKLYKITIDVGSEIGKRVVCAGLKQYYSEEELMNKKIILFVNLAPRKMRGIESQGMLLAAVAPNQVGPEEGVHQGGASSSSSPSVEGDVNTEGKDESEVRLIQPDKNIENGVRVR